MKDKKKSWFRRHWILTIILGFILLVLAMSIFQNIGNKTKYTDYSEDGLIVASSSIIVPQDSEINREWRISNITSVAANPTGLIEDAERQMSKTELLERSAIITRAYRFDSIDNAQLFYSQEKTKIDIRGVKDWSLGVDCFGIKTDVGLSGYAEGLCLRNNVVLYVKSSSGSYSYTSDGKDFMNLMLKKV